MFEREKSKRRKRSEVIFGHMKPSKVFSNKSPSGEYNWLVSKSELPAWLSTGCLEKESREIRKFFEMIFVRENLRGWMLNF